MSTKRRVRKVQPTTKAKAVPVEVVKVKPEKNSSGKIVVTAEIDLVGFIEDVFRALSK